MGKLERLNAFVEVVNAGGFAAAARQLDLSRSAVNKLVLDLEGELDTQLLHRTTRRVSLTETGRAFYDRCLDILAAVEEAEIAVTQLHEEPRGVLRLNAPMSFGILYLSKAIAEFMNQHPQLRVQLVLNDRFVDLVEEGFDMTVRVAEMPQTPDLVVHSLGKIRRLLCASPKYLKRYGSPRQPAELRDRPCLHYGYLATGTHWKLYDSSDNEHAIAIDGVLCANNGEVLRDAAISGLGIAFLPEFLVADALQQSLLVEVLPEYRSSDLHLLVVYPPNRHLSAKVRLLTEFLKTRFANPGGTLLWNAAKP